MKFLSTKRILLLIFITATIVFLSYCAVVYSNTSNELNESSKETVSLKLMLYLDKTEDNIFKLQIATKKELLDKNQENLNEIAEAKAALRNCMLVLDSMKSHNNYLNSQIGKLDSICNRNILVCYSLLNNNDPAENKKLNASSNSLLIAFKTQNTVLENYGRSILHEYKNNHDYNSARLGKLFVLMFISGAFIILLFFVRLWRNIVVQEAYEKKLTSFNNHLEKQVDAKTNELIAKNNRLETIYNAVQAYIVELDLNKHVQFVNKTRRGFKVDDIIGQSIMPYIYPPDQSSFENAFDSVLQSKTQIGLKYCVGTGTIHYWGILTPILTNNEVTSVLLTVHDITDLINKQNTLIAQNSKLDAIYNNTAALICELTLDQKVVILNKSIHVNNPEYFIGKTLGEIFGKPYQEKINQTISKVISKKKPYNFEFNQKGSDGKTIYYAGVYAPIITDDTVTSILLTALNITELKHKQKEVDRLIQMFNLSPSYKAIADMNLNFIMGNNSLRKVLEINDDDITKYNIASFRNPKGQAIIEVANAVLLEKGSWIGENSYISKTGKEIPVLQGIILHRDEEGNPEYLSTTAIDLSEQKKKEKEANDLKNIINESIAFFSITDINSNILFANQAVLDALEIPKNEDISNLNFNDFRSDEGAAVMQDARKMLFKTGKWIGELFYKSRSGKLIPALIVLVLHRNEKGEPEYIMSTGLNISIHKEATDKINNLNQELNKLANSLSTAREEERTEIAREIHDELGQHLTLLKMNAYWLKTHLTTTDTNITNKIQQLVDAAQNTIDTNRRLLNTLHPSMLEEIGLYASLDWHIKAFTKSTGIQTNLDVPKHLNFDKRVNLCVYRIIQECLTNVIRYAQASSVDININIADQQLSISVTDNGIGFDTNKIDTMNSHGLKGMRERVIALDGTINIVTSPGKGVSVKAIIPNISIVDFEAV